MENEIIVKQHNELNSHIWKEFDAIDYDVFWAICQKVQDHGPNKIKIPISEIQSLAAFKRKDVKKKEFIEKIGKLGEKIVSATLKHEDDDCIEVISLFHTFKYSKTQDVLEVSVHPKYEYWLNDLTGRYTKLDIIQSNQLKSVYSKSIYRYLMQYNDTGFWQIDRTELEKIFGMETKAKTSNVIRNLDNAINELEKFFPNLKYKKIYDTANTKGRPAVVGFRFTFKPRKRVKSHEGLTQEQIAGMTDAIWTGKYCPKCGEKIFSKNFTADKGIAYTKLGHTDYKTGGCDYRPYYDELLTKEEADAKFGGEPREVAKGPSKEAKAKQQQKEAEIFATEDREHEAEEAARLEKQERELTEKLGRKPTEEELYEDSKARALEAMKVYKY